MTANECSPLMTTRSPLGLCRFSELVGSVPAGTGQSTDVANGVEFAVALGNDLNSDILFLAVSLDDACVLALDGKVGVRLFGVGYCVCRRNDSCGSRQNKKRQDER